MITKLIAFEGIDGSGKTMQEDLLADYLKEVGYTVLRKSFPDYSGFFGLQIGALLAGGQLSADKIDSKSMCLWFALDRYSSFKFYRDGEVDFLLLNRYTVSNAVYQSIRQIDVGIEDNWGFVKNLEHKELGLPEPDLYLLFDIDPEKAEENVDARGARGQAEGRDVYESEQGLLLKARQKYLDIAEREENFEVITCMENGSMLAPKIIANLVQNALKKRGLVE